MAQEPEFPDISQAQRLTIVSGLVSLGLALVKIVAGFFGHSYALIADGIESLTDVVSSVVVLVGLTLSVRPPDDDHPFGHGKMETLATLFVSCTLLSAAALIAFQAIREIMNAHQAPSWFTLPVLVLVIVVKIYTSQLIAKSGHEHGSDAMVADSWHHISDAITSGAAFIGISLALIGGPGWEAADDWAALVACIVIIGNGVNLARSGIQELVDVSLDEETVACLRAIAASVEGVEDVEKIRARKSGLGYLMEIHIEVDANLTVHEGHEISGAVKGALIKSNYPVLDVVVHVEPFFLLRD